MRSFFAQCRRSAGWHGAWGSNAFWFGWRPLCLATACTTAFASGAAALDLPAATAGTAVAAPFKLPAIATRGSAEYHAGKMVWADLVTPDLAGSERFYAGLFGWTFKSIDAGKSQYAVAMLNGRPIAGLFQKTLPSGEQRQPLWLTFFAVRDVDAAEKTATEHGAQNGSPPKTFLPRGRQAVLTDPEGAVFALLASTNGDTADELADPGEWIWSVVFEHAPDDAAQFYKTVFGYDVFTLPPGDDSASHIILSTDDYARAGIHTLPTSGRRHAHWLNFVRVNDAAAAAAKAVSLGGRVLEEPYMDRHGGRIAIIADPLGVPVGLMEWVVGDTKAEPK